MSDSFRPKFRLKRLDDSYYQGHNWVHWNMTIHNRATGWLSEVVHLKIREALLHTMFRYRAACPVYCVMPDHGHFLWGGLAAESNQLNAARFFRQEWNRILKQDSKQGYRCWAIFSGVVPRRHSTAYWRPGSALRQPSMRSKEEPV